MSDKDKLSFHDGDEEEFHITDEDIDRELAAMETDHASVSSSDDHSERMLEKQQGFKQRLTQLKNLKRKHWIIIVAVVIFLFFGLIKLMGSRSPQASFDQIVPVQVHKAEVVTKKAETNLTQKAFEPTPLPDLALTPEPAAAPPPADASTAGSAVLKTGLSTITSNETKLTEALTSIQQQNQLLTQKLSELSSRVVGLEAVLSESNQAVPAASSAPMATPKTMEMPASSPLSQQTQPAMPEVPQYTVEAVVPQRAWIQKGDGSTMTVTIGEALPGLGAVVAIDPYSGNVTTASGTVIKYGS